MRNKKTFFLLFILLSLLRIDLLAQAGDFNTQDTVNATDLLLELVGRDVYYPSVYQHKIVVAEPAVVTKTASVVPLMETLKTNSDYFCYTTIDVSFDVNVAYIFSNSNRLILIYRNGEPESLIFSRI